MCEKPMCSTSPVSYTHLDVYKRQTVVCVSFLDDDDDDVPGAGVCSLNRVSHALK